MPQAHIALKFVNPQQKAFVEATQRNQCFNGGYGNGKTFAGCMKVIILAAKFPRYKVVVGRWRYSDLMKTTVQTFFKICPPELYDEKFGGAWVPSRGYLRLINGSEFLFMHFDDLDENAVRSLECNTVLLDQAEEIGENIYLHLDSRVGRWDMAEVPADLLKLNKDWPKNKFTGKPLVPSYMLLLCNPADEGELHWIWQRYHPDSLEWQDKWRKTHFYIEASSRENIALNTETLGAMETRDDVWKQRFIEGKWSKGGGTIHRIDPLSIIDVDDKWVQNFKKKANLYRSFDHGGAMPTACLWTASDQKIYIVYREYYQADLLISDHRRNIGELSGDEQYVMDVADPDIFVKRSQSRKGFWAVAEEYADRTLEGSDPIFWTEADNNEFATRNRINELLRVDPSVTHPVTGIKGAPRLYFVKRNEANPFGCFHVLRETSAQKFVLLDTINGKPFYSDDRNSKISDHAYDCLRYFCAIHAKFPKEPVKRPSHNSFFGNLNRLKALKASGNLNYGLPIQ